MQMDGHPLIVVTGPESSGKSTLAGDLSHRKGWRLVDEWARTCLEATGPAYTEGDVYRMGLHQHRNLEQALGHAPGPVVADTDLLTYRIWLEVRFGRMSPWLDRLRRRLRPAIYLLCLPDLPWVPDPLRESPDERDYLFDRYKRLLEEEGHPFAVIRGVGDLRLQMALDAVRHLAE